MFDILITGALVADGTGRELFRADAGIVDGRIARIAFDRPEVRNAFRPHTVDELYRALDIARQDPKIGVVLLTGNGPSPKDGGWAFCSGGDQRIRGRELIESHIMQRGSPVTSTCIDRREICRHFSESNPNLNGSNR